MIGNAAAAIQGAPATTLDIDFCIQENDATVAKLTKVAKELDAELINIAPLYQIQAPDFRLRTKKFILIFYVML